MLTPAGKRLKAEREAERNSNPWSDEPETAGPWADDPGPPEPTPDDGLSIPSDTRATAQPSRSTTVPPVARLRIDGTALLDELHDTLTRYVAFPDKNASAAVTLWIATTHALPAFECAPRLVLTSPQKRCAKSRTLTIIAGTCHKPLATSDATVAAIFRSIGGDHPPTLIIDEADAIWGTKKQAENNEDLRKLLNAGHERGRPAIRCVGPNQIPTPFAVFAMAALAGKGTGWVPDTISDRAVNITMRRRAPGETVSKFRSRRDGPVLEKLRGRLAEWVGGLTLTGEPDMPVEDRAADTWEPLVAIADAAGGHWPKMARAACRALVATADEADEDRSHGTKLLSDVRDIFAERGVSFLSSAELVAALRRIEESPWGEFELTASKLAYRLREFGIRTKHNPAGSARGYRLEDFWDAFQRYTRQNPSEASESQANDGFASDGLSNNPSGPVRSLTGSDGSENNPSDGLPQLTSDSDGLTGSDGVDDENVPPQCSECGDEPAEYELNGSRVCVDCLLAANNEEMDE